MLYLQHFPKPLENVVGDRAGLYAKIIAGQNEKINLERIDNQCHSNQGK